LLIVGFSATAASFSPDMYWLIFLRCLMGTGMGALIMVGYASFAEFIPPVFAGNGQPGFLLSVTGRPCYRRLLA
jgi:putative MFS transporter